MCIRDRVSSEAKISDTVTRGVNHFKIHDVFYHRSGPMTAGYGRSPCYVQLYFYDVDTAVNYRLREHYNQTCNNNITVSYTHLDVYKRQVLCYSALSVRHQLSHSFCCAISNTILIRYPIIT